MLTISQGRYLPVFAAEVYEQNARLVKAGVTPVNLSSVMIGTFPCYCICKYGMTGRLGNGMTDTFSMLFSYYDMACTSVSVPPILDIPQVLISLPHL
jgi:hypothetical protein